LNEVVDIEKSKIKITKPGYYEERDSLNLTLINVIEYINQGEVAPIEMIKEEVKSTLYNQQKREYLNNFDNEIYTPGVTADWRAQMSLGMNLQYNSWIFGLSGRVIYDQDPIGAVSDGFVVGTGVSYDVLKYSVSLTYMLSDTGVWQGEVDDFIDNTVVASFRYKYSENIDGWISGGMTSETPFISAGMRITF
jgi:hypothetical protein